MYRCVGCVTLALLLAGCASEKTPIDNFSQDQEVFLSRRTNPGDQVVPVLIGPLSSEGRAETVSLGTRVSVIQRLDPPPGLSPEDRATLEKHGGWYLVTIRSGPLAGQDVKVFARNLGTKPKP